MITRNCGYSDANCFGDLDKSKSTTDNIYTISEGAVWLIYVFTIWLIYFLQDLKLIEDGVHVSMFVDGTSAVSIMKEPQFNSRLKYVELKYHFIRKKVEKDKSEIFLIPSKESTLSPNFTNKIFYKACMCMAVR